MPQIVELFHRRHEELYTYALRDQEAVLVNARAAVIGVLPGLPQEPHRPAAAPSAPRGTRRIWLGAWTEVPVYDFESLAPARWCTARHRRVRHDHGADARGKHRHRHPAWLAGHLGAAA